MGHVPEIGCRDYPQGLVPSTRPLRITIILGNLYGSSLILQKPSSIALSKTKALISTK